MKKNKEYPSDEEIMELYKTDPGKAKETMINKYKKYIYHIIAKKYPTYQHNYSELPELFQHGCIGILLAMKTYDPEKGRFTTHCTPYIKNELTKYFQFLEDEKSDYFLNLHNKVKRAKIKLEECGCEISTESIMKETGMSRKLVIREANLNRIKVPYDSISGTKAPKACGMSEEMIIKDYLSVLPKINQQIVNMKIIDNKSFNDISRDLHINRRRVEREYKEGLRILRKKIFAN